MEMIYDVFISYSRKNMELADKVESSLKARGLRCFLDRETIELGEDFATRIAKSISHSEVVLLLWTPESNESENVAREIALADAYSKTIIPFQVGNFIPHYRLAYMLALLNRADKQQGFSDNELDKLTDWVIRSIRNSREKRGLPLERLAEQVKAEVSANHPSDIYEQEYLLGCEKFRQYDLDQAFELLLEPALEDYKDARMYLSYCISTNLRIRKVAAYRFEDLRSREDELKDNGFALYMLAVYSEKLLFDNDAAYSYAVRSMEAGSDYGTLFYVQCHDFGLGVERNFKKVIPVLRRMALNGNPGAQLWYGKCLLYGWNGLKDQALGLRLVRDGAEKGDMGCMDDLAQIYYEGIAVDPDFSKAVAIYERLIELGYAEAYKKLGRMYCYINGDSSNLRDPESFRKGFSYLMKGADLGEPNCMFELGEIYNKGYNGERKVNIAVKWYNRAAEAGLNVAYLALGWVYLGVDEYWDLGITIDREKAWEYLTEGAKLRSWDCYYTMAILYYAGHAPKEITALDALSYLHETVFGAAGSAGNAACRLYDIYHEGKDVPQDELKGIEYLKMAAEYGRIEAMVKLGKVLTADLTSPYADEILGFKYLMKAYDKGNVEAAIELARLSARGVGTFKDREKAKEYLQFAIDKEESLEALCEMGKLFCQAEGWYGSVSYNDASVPEAQKNAEWVIGLEYLKKAAEKRYAPAYLWLGTLLYDPEGYCTGHKSSEEEINESLKYLEEGASLNHPMSNCEMALSYCYGTRFLKKDFSKSEEFWLKAVDLGCEQAARCISDLYSESQRLGVYLHRMSDAYSYLLSSKFNPEIQQIGLRNLDYLSKKFAKALEKDNDFDATIFMDCVLPRKFMFAGDSSYKLGNFNVLGLDMFMKMHKVYEDLYQYVIHKKDDDYILDDLLVINYTNVLRYLISLSWLKIRSRGPELSEVTFFDHNKILEIAEGLTDEDDKNQLSSTVELYLKLEEFYKEINRQLTIKS